MRIDYCVFIWLICSSWAAARRFSPDIDMCLFECQYGTHTFRHRHHQRTCTRPTRCVRLILASWWLTQAAESFPIKAKCQCLCFITAIVIVVVGFISYDFLINLRRRSAHRVEQRPIYRGFALAAAGLGSSPGLGPFAACMSPSLSPCFWHFFSCSTNTIHTKAKKIFKEKKKSYAYTFKPNQQLNHFSKSVLNGR